MSEQTEGAGVGALTIPAAAKLRPGDVVRILGPNSWELVEDDEVEAEWTRAAAHGVEGGGE